jgi:hypothetical protein
MFCKCLFFVTKSYEKTLYGLARKYKTILDKNLTGQTL